MKEIDELEMIELELEDAREYKPKKRYIGKRFKLCEFGEMYQKAALEALDLEEGKRKIAYEDDIRIIRISRDEAGVWIETFVPLYVFKVVGKENEGYCIKLRY